MRRKLQQAECFILRRRRTLRAGELALSERAARRQACSEWASQSTRASLRPETSAALHACNHAL
eukprot:4694850-Alexandrium_andersonii.AAC.1